MVYGFDNSFTDICLIYVCNYYNFTKLYLALICGTCDSRIRIDEKE